MHRFARAGLAIVAAMTLGFITISSASGSAPHDPPQPGVAAPSPDQLGAQSVAANLQTLYVPIAPCRIVDTRAGSGGHGTPIGASTRTYYVGGTQMFVPQGGKSGGCGIPVGATAIAATITAVNPHHGGFIRAWPNGANEPTATLLNYATSSIGTGATVPIKSSAALALKVRNYSGPTDLVIDVAGYYIPQIYGTFTATGSLYNGSGRLVAYSHSMTGYYALRADRDLSSCTPVVSSYYFSNIVSAYTEGNLVHVQLTTAADVAINGDFQVHVNC